MGCDGKGIQGMNLRRFPFFYLYNLSTGVGARGHPQATGMSRGHFKLGILSPLCRAVHGGAGWRWRLGAHKNERKGGGWDGAWCGVLGKPIVGDFMYTDRFYIPSRNGADGCPIQPVYPPPGTGTE